MIFKKMIEPKWVAIVTTIISVFAMSLSSYILLTIPKIGYIDSSVLMEKYTGMEKARKQLKTEIEKWSENIRTLGEEIKTLNDKIQREGTSWAPDVRKKQFADFENKQNDYNRYEKAIREKASNRERELFQPVMDEINIQLEKYAKEKGIDIILGTLTGGNILYGGEKLDLTKDFLAYANSNL